MSQRKLIFSFLLLLLFVFLNSNVQSEAHAIYYKGHSAGHNNLIAQADGHQASIPFFTRHTIKRYDLKVRYMVGECRFDAAPLFISIFLHYFTDRPSNARNCFFVPSSGHSLFKLRGPPSVA